VIGRTVGPYTILERLGGGGMGVVYRARDERLGRDVALKFLPLHLGDEPTARDRFIREARAASALDHPNVCTVHDVGESDDGSMYLCMAYYDGESLKQRLARGRMTVSEAERIAREVASGLARAHDAGILHRDIKPANVMLTARGEVKIVDFGLADLTGDVRITRTGATLGTLPYMSPEQIQGRELDARTDLWSLGVLLYEMLTGERPFVGDAELLVSRAILEDDPPPPSAANPDVPATLDQLVRSLLAKDRERRPRSAAEVVAALGGPPSTDSHLMTATAHRALWRGRPRVSRWIRVAALGVAVTLAVAAAVAWLATRPGDVGFDRVAVMPFDDFTGDPAQAHVAEGVASSLLGRLAEVDGLSVVARSEAWSLARSGVEPREVGRRLDAGLLVEGAVGSEAGRIELTATLLGTATADVLWSYTESGPSAELPRLQDELADRLARLLSITTSSYERGRLADDPARCFAAYDDLVRAERALDAATDATGTTPAVELYRQAVRGDPAFALGWAGLSEALWSRARREGRTEGFAEAEEAARRALQLDPTLPAGKVALARVLRDTGRREEATAELEEALAAHAHPEEVHLELAQSYRRVGDVDAAENALRAATAVAPREWMGWTELGNLLWMRGEYEAAREAYTRSAAVAPEGVTLPRDNIIAVDVSRGHFDAAIEAAERLPGPIESANLASNIGTAYYFSERPDRMERAEEYYRLAVRLAPRNDRVRRNLADVLAHVGREDEARAEYAAALDIVEERLKADPDDPDLRLRRAFFAARSGDCVAALAWAQDLRSEVATVADAVHQVAYVDALCGRREAALDGVRRALELGVSPEIIGSEDEFASLRDDPEFRRLVGAR